MSRVSIHFEDADNGEILTRVDFQGQYNAGFPSHKLASMVIGFLDDNATRKTFIAEPAENDEDILRKNPETLKEIVEHGC